MLNACSKEAPRVRNLTNLICTVLMYFLFTDGATCARRRGYDKEVTSARRSRITALHLSACTATLRSA